MLYRSVVRDAIVTALIRAQTAAGSNVFAPRDWPETPVQLPTLIVTMPAENKQSWGPNGPKFTTTATIVVLGRLLGTTEMDAEAKLEALIEQIQNAVLPDFNVLALIQEFSSVDTQISITDDGEDQIGEASVSFGCVFPEIFYPGTPQPLTSIEMTLTTQGTATIKAKDVLPQ
jgi:hypothetical protein